LQILVSASNAVLADGTSFPAPVGNGTILTGYPAGTIKNAISTAGDLSQIQVQVNMVGTEFGSDGKASYPLPLFINLTNSGYTCSNSSRTSGEFRVSSTHAHPTYHFLFCSFVAILPLVLVVIKDFVFG
jgi:hypothetical protein